LIDFMDWQNASLRRNVHANEKVYFTTHKCPRTFLGLFRQVYHPMLLLLLTIKRFLTLVGSANLLFDKKHLTTDTSIHALDFDTRKR